MSVQFNKKRNELVNTFINPGKEYRGKPFWSWNGELEKDELIRQAKTMKEMGFGGYFMHARSGLITEYLGDEWFELTNAVADASEKLDMEAWLYDEDRWPSGSAGGKATAEEKYRMKSIVMYDMPAKDFVWTDDIVCAFWARVEGKNLFEYKKIERGENIPEEEGIRVLKYVIELDPPNNNYNGNTYLDTMSLEAVNHFINLTHEEYKARCGDRLGRNIEGIFTDEPHRGHGLDDFSEKDGVCRCSMAWTDDLFDEFKVRYGYDVEAILPEVFYCLNGERVSKARIDYFDLADNLFVERFAKPIYEWCKKNNMRFTGHVLHENSLSTQTVTHGSLMRFYEFMDDPGVDVLSHSDKYYWIVKQLTSAARQKGKKWLLSELYGCTGWQTNFSDYKGIGDWQTFFGINLRCQHLSWYTMEGEAKRDYPASILHQSAWYKEFERIETYFARFGLVISEGDPVCDVLVFNPIESAWALAYAGWSDWLYSTDPDVIALEKHYEKLFNMLAGHQIDFDYGEEQMMASDWEVGKDERGAFLRIGLMKYRSVVVSGAVTMRSSSVEMFREFLLTGGKVVFAGFLPSYVDGVRCDEPEKLSKMQGAVVVPFDGDKLFEALKENASSPVIVRGKDGRIAENIFCQHRSCKKSDYSFSVMLNVDRENRYDCVVDVSNFCGKQMQLWDMMTGERFDLGKADNSIELSFEPGQERVLAFTDEWEDLPNIVTAKEKDAQKLEGPVRYNLDEENVLVLDYAKRRFNGGEWTEANEVLKVDRELRYEVGIERRGGEMLQPWFAKLYKNEEYGDIELSYTFNVDKKPEGELFLICERPENVTVTLNGSELKYDKADGFWIDICFKRIRVPLELIKEGENEVIISGTFKRTTNIEALYLVGDFGVEIKGKKPHICDLPDMIGLTDLKENKLPFYSGYVTYYFDVPKLKAGQRIRVKLSDLRGSLALVHGRGGDAAIMTAPYAADVTAKEDGKLEITLVCTRRNTFGPLHLVMDYVDAYGPGSFVTYGENWTDDYALVECRLSSDITIAWLDE
ncbi:MAG: hypothetical protein E7334_06155 [Clostridiales bacterium]|nr:hypothetical protein [Clostridiales bacterium]